LKIVFRTSGFFRKFFVSRDFWTSGFGVEPIDLKLKGKMSGVKVAKKSKENSEGVAGQRAFQWASTQIPCYANYETFSLIAENNQDAATEAAPEGAPAPETD